MIRLATPDDIPTLLKMIAGLAAHHGDPSLATHDTLMRDLFGPVHWARALIAEIDGVPVGYAALIPRASLHNGTRGMDMHHLFVAAEHRGRGIGRALIAACEGEVRTLGGTFMLVGTDPDNHDAQAVYDHAGFTRRGSGGVQFVKPLKRD